MAVVAGVAVVVAVRIETARMRLRRLDYQLLDRPYHRRGEVRRDGSGLLPRTYEPPSSVYNSRKAAYHAAMARKWADSAPLPLAASRARLTATGELGLAPTRGAGRCRVLVRAYKEALHFKRWGLQACGQAGDGYA